MHIVKIEGKTDWTCFRAKGGHWVAVCDPLGLTVQSDTWATLMEDIGQTLNAMFRDLLKSHELGPFLRNLGWRPVGRLPARPADVWFDVPFIPQRADRDPQVAVH